MTNYGNGNGGKHAMNLSEFAALVERHGAEPRRWPAARRDAATELTETSPEARALLHDAAALDRLLDGAAVPPPSPHLREAILAAAPRQMPAGRKTTGFWSDLRIALGGWRPASVAFAASLALGIASGSVLVPGLAEDPAPDVAQLAFFDDNFAEY